MIEDGRAALHVGEHTETTDLVATLRSGLRSDAEVARTIHARDRDPFVKLTLALRDLAAATFGQEWPERSYCAG